MATNGRFLIILLFWPFSQVVTRKGFATKNKLVLGGQVAIDFESINRIYLTLKSKSYAVLSLRERNVFRGLNRKTEFMDRSRSTEVSDCLQCIPNEHYRTWDRGAYIGSHRHLGEFGE
jgi:hypothetical protein